MRPRAGILRGLRRLRGPVVALLALGALCLGLDLLFPPDLARYRQLSLALEAADGTKLDMLESPDGFWRLPATPDEVSENFLHLLIRTENKRFWVDPGVDPLAMARAVAQLVTHGHVVSGGSTLTMQVARLLTPHRHDIAGKFFDLARALQLTAHYSKRQILAMYLTLAPYGGNIEGIRAASLIYFGKEPRALTDEEAALLVALPRSPARLRPDRHPAAAWRAARLVLARAGWEQNFDPGAPPPVTRTKMPALAPHLAWHLRAQGYSGDVATTLDADMQARLVALAASERPWLGRPKNLAALVVDNRSHAVLGYLGGADFFGPHGMVDMVRALRSPGSALKPFIYGMALDDSLIVPGTLLPDSPRDEAGYAPKNFDHAFHGMVTATVALQQSFNLPAVELLRAVGPARFVAALRAAGANPVLPPGALPSLAVALGGFGISLRDMAMLYAGLADGGEARPLRLLADQAPGRPLPEMTVDAAARIGAMLRGAPLPAGVAPDQNHAIAYKTGTSYGYRDAWAAGFSGDYTVVVWVGRIDGTPSPGAYGRATAAPIMFRIFSLLPPDRHLPPPAPPAPDMASLSPALRVFGARAPAVARSRPRILFPPAGARLQVTDGAGGTDPVSLEAAGGRPPYRWVVNGVMLPPAAAGFSMLWQPDGPGFAHISVIDRAEAAASEDVMLR